LKNNSRAELAKQKYQTSAELAWQRLIKMLEKENSDCCSNPYPKWIDDENK